MDRKLIFITLILLLSGFLYYYLLRKSNIVAFSWLGIEKREALNFRWNSYFLWFPTFIHTFLFSILSWWAMGFKYPKLSIVFWTTINLVAEFGQSIEKSFFENFPPILKNYFQRGIFDWWDIISILGGAFFAYIVILKLEKEL